jgi:hypothetical protein
MQEPACELESFAVQKGFPRGCHRFKCPRKQAFDNTKEWSFLVRKLVRNFACTAYSLLHFRLSTGDGRNGNPASDEY